MSRSLLRFISFISLFTLFCFVFVGSATFYPQETKDGYITYIEDDECWTYDNTDWSSRVGDDHSNPTVENYTYYSIFKFDTSTIPNDATINSAQLDLYAHSYEQSGGAPTWSVQYISKKTYNKRDVQCWDFFTDGTDEGTLDWGGTTGSKSKIISTSSINTRGFTTFMLNATWHPEADGHYSYINIRTSEYTGISSDPVLTVTWTGGLGDETCYPPNDSSDWTINSSINCSNVRGNITGNLNITEGASLYLYNTTFKMNLSDYHIRIGGFGKLFIENGSSIGGHI